MVKTAGLALVVLALLVDSVPARADRGVSVDVGTIDVTQRLSRGGEYKLPAIGVRNPGTEVTRYRMGVEYVEGQPARRPPASWFTFTPAEMTLEPGESKSVDVRLDIPTGARPDDYEALIQAEIAPEGEGTTVGAAAAARLRFTIKPSNLLQAWQLEAQDFARDYAPWTYAIPSAGAVAAGGWWARRKFTISVRRRP